MESPLGGLHRPPIAPSRPTLLRSPAAALLALDGLLMLGTAITSTSGLSLTWAADVAVGLTALGLASSLLDADFEGHWVGLWALLTGLASVAAQIGEEHPFDAFLRVPGALALVLVSVAKPGALRCLLAGTLLALQCSALGSDLSSLRTGRAPLGEARLRFEDQLGEPQASAIEGREVAYHLALPRVGRWFEYLPPPDERAPAYDRWVVDPERSAFLRVRVEPFAGASHLDLDTLVDRVGRHHSSAEQVSMEPLPDDFDGARLVHLREPRGPHRREFWVGVFVRADMAFEVTSEAPAAAFLKMGDALRASVAGLAYEPATPPSLSADVLIALKQATALVRTELSAGSGVVIARTDDGTYVLTNAHVIVDEQGDPPRRLGAWFPGTGDEGRHPADLIQCDRSSDLALLRTEGLPIEPLALRRAGNLPERTPAFAAGFPLGPHLASGASLAQPTINAGRLLGLAQGGGRGVALGLNPGNSGGPVIASDGSVLGLAQAMIPGSETSVMVSAEAIRGFLPRDLPVSWNAGPLLDIGGSWPSERIRGEVESALVQIVSGGEISPGLVVGEDERRLLLVARADFTTYEGDREVTASFGLPDRPPSPRPAEILRIDAQSGLALLAVARFEGAPRPPSRAELSDQPETTPLQSVGWRVRTSPFVPREPVVRLWRSGVLSSKQVDSTGRMALALADVGINPDLRGGPIIDAHGSLIGFTTRDGDPTNLTRLAPTEAIERLLNSVGVGEGSGNIGSPPASGPPRTAPRPTE